ncbi:MAG: SufD family Fe-S cluster assembly protein [Thermoflexaceae bacterium]|nr:SufD family Fe-S cluster assembly protein [Thermoflexaceae bacterium]
MSSTVEKAMPGLLTPALSRAIGEQLGDPAWLAEIRQGAAQAAGALSMPTTMERPWKYLDVSRLDLEPYTPAAGAVVRPGAAEARAPYGIGPASALLVQNNSETIVAEPGAGVTVVDFAAAGAAQQALIREHLATGVPVERNRFTALHYAFLRGGVLVDVTANSEVDGPVRIVRDYEQGGQFAAPHTLVVTGANSRVSIVEDYRSGPGDVLAIPAVELVPGPGSVVTYTALHRWGAETRVFGEQRALPGRDAAVVGVNVAVGGRVVKSHIESSLTERGSSSELYGLILGDDQQQFDFYTVQDHIGPDTRSDLLFKAALRGSARSAYYGVTRVGLGARRADANQENRNLLLSKKARADSDPVLEILTNDVIRASHGATAGPVSEDQLFYLQARAIPRPQAEALLVRGFLAQVLDRVRDEALREELGAVVVAKLGAAG